LAHGVFTNCTGLRLVYLNGNWAPSYSAPPNAITIKAGVEINGVNYPVYFRGQRSVSIDPGGMAISDPLHVTVLASYANIFSRTYVLMGAAGQQYPQFTHASNANDCSYHVDATASDLSGGTGALDNAGVTSSNTSIYGPTMICAKPLGANRTPVTIGGVGDSVLSGTADTTNIGFLCSWGERALLPNGYGFNKISIGSDFFASGGWGADVNKGVRAVCLENCSYAVSEMGINDVGSTGDAFQTAYLREWNYLNNMGIKVVQSTMAPSTSSTVTAISYSAASNQTFTSAVNLSGIETMNFTSTVAAAPTSGVANLSVVSAGGLNAYQNYNILMTSGAAKGRLFTVNSNTATSGGNVTLTLSTTWGAGNPLPSIGDTFLIAPRRVTYNEWFRQKPSPLYGVIDTADAVECNSSGVQTRNGGYWYAPALISDGIVGTMAAPVANAGTVVDANGSRGWVTGNYVTTGAKIYIVFTSGALAGQASTVSSVSGATITYSASSFTTAAAPGDTYKIVTMYGNNGPHPGYTGNVVMAAVLAAQASTLFK
jgi:hypothetical protein